MNILDGIRNFLMFVNDHWTEIIVVAGLLLAIGKKVADYLSLSDEEKIEVAKRQLNETMLKLVTKAENDYNEWVKAGAVKRAEVLDTIFQQYPILNRVADQDALIAEIDKMIDDALVEMREILSKNQEQLS